MLPAAALWQDILPQRCRQQHCGCHNIAGSNIVATTILLSLVQSCCGGKIMAATILLTAGLWQPQHCSQQDCGSHNLAASPSIVCAAHWAVCYILRAKRGLSVSCACDNVWCVSHKKANAPEHGMEQHYGKCSNYFDAIMLPAAAL